jgi:hypothetical protein
LSTAPHNIAYQESCSHCRQFGGAGNIPSDFKKALAEKPILPSLLNKVKMVSNQEQVLTRLL